MVYASTLSSRASAATRDLSSPFGTLPPMTERKQFRAIRGTRDILPPDSALWNWFERTARDVFESFNFREIRTPIFEDTLLFARSIGTDTDVVSKEMYTFEDRPLKQFLELRQQIVSYGPRFKDRHGVFGHESVPFGPEAPPASVFLHDLGVFLDEHEAARKVGAVPETVENQKRLDIIRAYRQKVRDHLDKTQLLSEDALAHSLMTIVYRVEELQLSELVTLRPEATASVVRAYIEHGMHALPGNQKLYYVGPMFRRERPQKGRYRQFYQIGAEVLGPSDAPAIDAEVIEMLLVLFRARGAHAHHAVRQFDRLQGVPAEICRAAARGTAQGERPARRGQPAPHRDEPAARARLQAARRAGDHRHAAAHLRPSLRRLPRAFRQAERRTEPARHRLRGKLAPRPRPRLLHAHHVRSDRRRARLAECRVRRRAL